MRRLDHYISITIIQMTAIVLLFLIGVGIFVSIIGETRDLGKGDYDLFAAIRYVFLTIPNEIYHLFPSAGLVGSLLGLGVLAYHQELTAMRAAGVSIAQVVKIVLRVALLLTLLVTLFAEWLNPDALHIAQTEKTLAKSGGQALATAHGLWIREQNQFIHIRTVLTDQSLEGITIYQFNPLFQLTAATYAKTAIYAKDHWQLVDVQRSLINLNHIKTEQNKEENWYVKLDPTILKVATVEPQEMSLAKLHIYLKYLQQNNLNNNVYQLVFWQRIMQPFATMVMILLAIPFVFGPLRNVTLGLRTVAGLCIGFIFYLVNNFLGPVAVMYGISPLLASMLPIFLFAGIGVFLLRKI